MRAIVNGTEIFFDLEGGGLHWTGDAYIEKPCVVALHGGPGFDQGYLRPSFTPLASECQILFVDLRGQGRSGRPPLETCSLEQMADDVAALCSELGLVRPIVFGHSAGGFVALQLAVRHPGLPGGLVLCGTTAATNVGIAASADGAPTLAARAGPAAMEAAARVFSGDITERTITTFFDLVGEYYGAPGNADLVRALLRRTRPNVPMMRHFIHAVAPSYDVRNRLGGIAVETRVLVGAHDWVCPPSASEVLAAVIPRAKLERFGESGHMLFAEEPARFRATMLSFLKLVQSGGTAKIGC